MLALATHEPHFRVLREDVFADANKTGCRICGQEGHFAAQCTGKPKEKDTSKPPEKKPFIFLDVAVLREYLAIELNLPNIPFDLERALDDWVFLIFFVGNDFLPHLPSLEIREGAIDTLLKIWKDELPRMGGYLTEHGTANKANVQIMLEGLAKREDEIFRKRREAEERQEQNAKRRKLDQQRAKEREQDNQMVEVTPAPPAATGPHLLPARPAFDVFTGTSLPADPTFAGSNSDVVANRAALRLANLSAADAMRAELAGAAPLKPTSRATLSGNKPPVPSTPPSDPLAIEVPAMEPEAANGESTTAEEKPSISNELDGTMDPEPTQDVKFEDRADTDRAEVAELIENAVKEIAGDADKPHGVKRPAEAMEKDGESSTEEEEAPAAKPALKVNPDGTVDQEDTVKLWEPGYKERYYRSKFGIELTDTETRKQITTAYMEGLCWVLQYYYQGAPSWTWFYPYHFAPFAADFEDVEHMDIKFNLGAPFKPYEQLMGVFPAASRVHIPVPFQSLMTDEDSPIIDFYPTEFEIDMNGKKMAWQGVALLPFIDEKRLLGAMAERYPKLTEDEVRRNKWGVNHIYVSEGNDLYDFFCGLYTKRKSPTPIPLDTHLSHGISGTVLHDPNCVPESSYPSPLTRVGQPDIVSNRTLSAQFFYPKQTTPHRSALLPGARPAPKILGQSDAEHVRRGGEIRRGRGGGGGGRGGRGREGGFGGRETGFASATGGYHDRGGGSYSGYDNTYGNSYGGGYGGGYYGNQDRYYGNQDRGRGGHQGGGRGAYSASDRNGSFGHNGRNAYHGGGGYGGYGGRR
ncbi:5'-3' exoribonuclease 2 [Ceratobasidium sp. 394]|nr:5'-3' exoribonuclease 2 [Ceratobasidium sp. 394]